MIATGSRSHGSRNRRSIYLSSQTAVILNITSS